MKTSSQSEITTFLGQFKFFAENLACFTWIETEKNMKSLAEFGINTSDVINIIFALTYMNYCSGPEADRDYPDHNIWVFGYNLNNEDMYIKLSDNFSYGKAKCLSFHKAEAPITYHYNKERE